MQELARGEGPPEDGSAGVPGVGDAVVGVDGGHACETATRWAAGSAAAHGDGVRLVAAVASPAGEDEEEWRYRRGLTTGHVARLAAELARTRPGVRCATRVVRGSPVRLLVAESAAARLMVLGAHSARGPWPVHPEAGRLGSTSRQVVLRAWCPVVLVPPTGPTTVEEVVVGDDGSGEAAAAVDVAAEEATVTGCPLLVVRAFRSHVPPSVYRDTRQYTAARDEEEARHTRALEATRQRVLQRWPRCRVRTLLGEGDPQDVLVLGGRRLVVVGRSGTGGGLRSLLGSTSLAVLRSARCPVAVVPPRWQPG